MLHSALFDMNRSKEWMDTFSNSPYFRSPIPLQNVDLCEFLQRHFQSIHHLYNCFVRTVEICPLFLLAITKSFPNINISTSNVLILALVLQGILKCGTHLFSIPLKPSSSTHRTGMLSLHIIYTIASAISFDLYPSSKIKIMRSFHFLQNN